MAQSASQRIGGTIQQGAFEGSTDNWSARTRQRSLCADGNRLWLDITSPSTLVGITEKGGFALAARLFLCIMKKVLYI
jgi:hypothetical protein